MRRSSLVSKTGAAPHSQVIRPKRCHNCQKMIAADKYV